MRSAEAAGDGAAMPESRSGAAGQPESADADRRPVRQAVVMIHGMGEPMPMETLEGFVEAAWRSDGDLKVRSRDVWTNPTSLAGSHEMRRIVTGAILAEQPSSNEKLRISTDFYEFYWSDAITGTTWEQFKDWFMALLLRAPRQIPADVRVFWGALWALLLGGIGLAIAKLVIAADDYNYLVAGLGAAGVALVALRIMTFPRFLILAAVIAASALAVLYSGFTIAPAKIAGGVVALYGGLAAAVVAGFLLPYFGDVARYVRRKPPNIAGRKAVRERGLKLLTDLHAAEDLPGKPRYDRIVIAAHSLGSIIAFDLIAHLWGDREEARSFDKDDAAARAALTDVEVAATHLEAVQSEDNRAAYRAAQRSLFAVMAAQTRNQRWIVSDLVTLGSPLTHAEFLLARDADDLAASQRSREIPRTPPVMDQLWKNSLTLRKRYRLKTCPPTPNFFPYGATSDTPCGLFYSHGPDASARWRLHHAAPFAAIRWTNIYDRETGATSASLTGDLISGPVAALFGQGVSDERVALQRPAKGWLRPRIVTHTLYWFIPAGKDGKPENPCAAPHLLTLRRALDLSRKSF